MTEPLITVEGLSSVLRSLKAFDAEADKTLRETLRGAAQVVRDEAQSRFEQFDQKSAAAYRVYVRTRGIDVEQSLGRVTGLRGDYGSLQMREALVPSLDDHKEELEKQVQAAIMALGARYLSA